MLDNRRKVTIVEFLRSLPNPEKIQAASTDMYRTYREAIQEVLPHVVHVVDKYHIIRITYAEPEYVTHQVVREVNLGTDLSTLLAEIDTWPTKD